MFDLLAFKTWTDGDILQICELYNGFCSGHGESSHTETLSAVERMIIVLRLNRFLSSTPVRLAKSRRILSIHSGP